MAAESLIFKRWIPILDRYRVVLPLQCPLNPARDVFYFQEVKKHHFVPQWTCGFCGKAFYHETHINTHFDNRHQNELNEIEDSVCFADFCDVMRCEVLQERLRELEDVLPPGTALDLWQHPMSIAKYNIPHSSPTSADRPGSRSLMKSPATEAWRHWVKPHAEPVGKSSQPGKSQSSQEDEDTQCQLSHPREREKPVFSSSSKNSVPSFSPPSSWKDICSDDHLGQLRRKCQRLVRQCASGLAVNLTLEQLRDVEAALHRSVCWYLTCERYWEAGAVETPVFPWGITTALVLLLTLGVSLCYYVVWVLCEPQEAACTPSDRPTYDIPRQRYYSSRNNRNSLSQATSLSSSASRQKICASNESENECKDSGFNEGYSLENACMHTFTDMDGRAYRTRHYSEDSKNSASQDDSRYYLHEERFYNYASTFTPNYEQRRLRRNRYNYLDDFDNFEDTDGEESSLGRERSDSFIYVSYPKVENHSNGEQR